MKVSFIRNFTLYLKAGWLFQHTKAGVRLATILGVGPAIILGGCTMTPLYQPASNTHAVKVATMPNREGQLLKNELLTLFPNPSQSQSYYRLEPTITFNHQEAGLRRDATAKRQVLTAKVAFSLLDEASQKIVYQDAIDVTTGYNVISSVEVAAVSLVASEKDARICLMHQAAQEIKILVESFLMTKATSLHTSNQGSLNK